MGLLLGLAACASGGGEDLSLAPSRQPAAPAQNLALDTTASGFFLNMNGDVLTAAHAVKSCPHLFVIKGDQAAPARVVAQDGTADIAVVHSWITPPLPATLTADDGAESANRLVFAAAYSVLQGMPDRNVMSNGLTTGASGTGSASNVRLSFYSGAQPGASGSAVVSTTGLVIGMIVQRETGGAMVDDGGFVLGVPVAQLKSFLRDHGIAFQESDAPQLGPNQPTGPRADTIAAGILCG